MQSLAEVRTEEFQQVLTAGYVRTARIISAALIFGIIALAAAVLFFFHMTTHQPASEASRGMVDLMTYCNFAFTCIALLSGKFLYERQFTPSALQKAVTQEIRDANGQVMKLTPAEQCGMKIRSAWLIRAAMFEGPAFLGLQVTIVAIQNGVVSLEPMYAANMLTAVPALVYFITTFPSPERLQSVFEARIQNRA